MGAFLGIPLVDCSQNGTIDWNQGSLTAELAKYPVYTLIFTYASVASIVVLVLFFEAVFFIATRVPPSAVANHRINTAVMMSAYPVFVMISLPAVLIPSAAPFCLAMDDLYLAYVMFKFVVLQVDYYGGHRKMMVKLAAEKVQFKINSPVLCCFFCLKPRRLTRQSFTVIKILVLQVAIIKPILTFLQAIAGFAQLTLAGIPSMVILALTVLSTMTAVTGMNMLTKASSSTELEKYCLRQKSLLMTGCLLIIGLQPTILMVATWFRPLGCHVPFPASVVSSQWQSFLLIVESTLLMIPVLRYYRTADGNVVGVPPPIELDDEEANTGIGKMRNWIRRHTLM